jgi:hypothetical protein
MVRKKGTYSRNKKPTITIMGDSHARGIAGELLHLNRHLNVIGLVKPNADLTEVLNSASKDLDRKTKSDTLILFGGSSGFAKKMHGSNITSLVNFLEDSQHTNIFLVEVPLRNDIEIESPVSEQIVRHNKQLHKIIILYKHATIIKSTTERKHFTRHGSYLNRVGKEVVSKEINNFLLASQNDRKAAVIQLSWKEESGKVNAQPS